MFRDAVEYDIASHQHCVEIERALCDVSVGQSDVQAVAAKIAKKVTQGHPVIETCVMNGKILKKLTNHCATIRRIGASKEL
ncbi:MAG: hypothetical protein QOK37_3374 [Thermoanaerobaculia bacterium]|nr:hypothetical protein [Thermoanaerobaculia bacterium]